MNWFYQLNRSCARPDRELGFARSVRLDHDEKYGSEAVSEQQIDQRCETINEKEVARSGRPLSCTNYQSCLEQELNAPLDTACIVVLVRGSDLSKRTAERRDWCREVRFIECVDQIQLELDPHPLIDARVLQE